MLLVHAPLAEDGKTEHANAKKHHGAWFRNRRVPTFIYFSYVAEFTYIRNIKDTKTFI